MTQRTAMKPIQTYYNGHHFRSRLEARWAVFFDRAGIEYRYEPEGFEIDADHDLETPAHRYLPDFYLLGLGTYVEVKGEADDQEQRRIAAAAKQLPNIKNSPDVSIVILGDVPNIAEGAPLHRAWTSSGRATNVRFHPEELRDEWGGLEFAWTGQPTWPAPIDVLRAYIFPTADKIGSDREFSRWSHPDIRAAYHKARAARFEFGETPKAARS